MKKQVLFTILMLLPFVAMADDSGACGDNLTWTYTEATKTLTISGTGAMADYHWLREDAAPFSDSPWFKYRDGITHVVINSGVTSIGACAFQANDYLQSVDIPNTVSVIGQSAFSGCDNLSSISIPNSVTSIERSAFAQCALTSIEFPDGVKSIGERAFVQCKELQSVEFSNSVTNIGERAFSGCEKLQSIVIPSSITTLANHIFYNCPSLSSVKIPNSVTTIGANAFNSCTSLTSIEIPNGVVSIGENVFTFCTGLHDIYCYAEHVPEIDNAAFVSVNLENAILHVPASALDAYTTTAPWSNFSNIVALTEEDYADGISPLRLPLNGEKCNAIYNLQGQRIKTLQKGLNIVDGKKVMVK